MQNDATIRLNRSIERKYERTNNECTIVTEQNPHLVPHDNSWKFKRANLAVTAPICNLVLSESLIFVCNSNSRFF